MYNLEVLYIDNGLGHLQSPFVQLCSCRQWCHNVASFRSCLLFLTDGATPQCILLLDNKIFISLITTTEWADSLSHYSTHEHWYHCSIRFASPRQICVRNCVIFHGMISLCHHFSFEIQQKTIPQACIASKGFRSGQVCMSSIHIALRRIRQENQSWLHQTFTTGERDIFLH